MENLDADPIAQWLDKQISQLISNNPSDLITKLSKNPDNRTWVILGPFLGPEANSLLLNGMTLHQVYSSLDNQDFLIPELQDFSLRGLLIVRKVIDSIPILILEYDAWDLTFQLTVLAQYIDYPMPETKEAIRQYMRARLEPARIPRSSSAQYLEITYGFSKKDAANIAEAQALLPEHLRPSLDTLAKAILTKHPLPENK